MNFLFHTTDRTGDERIDLLQRADTPTPTRASKVPATEHGGPTSDEARAPDDYTASALANRTAVRILDVLAGRRPLHQIRGWVSRPVAGLLTAMLRDGQPTGPHYRLRSVHACLTNASTVEACAVIADTRRSRALTMRLERADTDWSCTLLALL